MPWRRCWLRHSDVSECPSTSGQGHSHTPDERLLHEPKVPPAIFTGRRRLFGGSADLAMTRWGYEPKHDTAKRRTLRLARNDEATEVAQNVTVTPEDDFNEVGTQHTVTATTTNQFGEPVDADVTFEGVAHNGTTQLTTTRATGTDNEVGSIYTGPDTSGTDNVTVTIADVDGNVIDTAPATKTWFEVAAQGNDVAAAEVLGSDSADNVVYVDDAGQILVFDYATGDLFFLDGSAVTAATFEAALEAAVEDGTVDDFLDVVGYGDATVDTRSSVSTPTSPLRR